MAPTPLVLESLKIKGEKLKGGELEKLRNSIKPTSTDWVTQKPDGVSFSGSFPR